MEQKEGEYEHVFVKREKYELHENGNGKGYEDKYVCKGECNLLNENGIDIWIMNAKMNICMYHECIDIVCKVKLKWEWWMYVMGAKSVICEMYGYGHLGENK